MSRRSMVAEVEARIAERLGPEACEHSMAVARAAARLAEAYGVDPERAYLAGLLHDWAREMSGAELVSSAGEYGLEVSCVDGAVPYLLHARVGARQVAEEFSGIDDDVVAAVSAHTFGDVEMSDLTRIVYIADMIEPGRDFEGVEALRGAVGTVDLDELFARAYSETLYHLVRDRRHIHPQTVAVWNRIVERGEAR